MNRTHASIALAIAAASVTTAQAELILYDSFDYASAMVGQGGGSGAWTGSWTNRSGGSDAAPTAGLQYGELVTSGGAVTTTKDVGTANTWLVRTFDGGSFFDSGNTIWMSVLMQRNDSNKKFNITLANADTSDFLGAGLAADNASSLLMASINGTSPGTAGEAALNKDTTFTNGQTFFAVARISVGASITGAGHHAVDVWLNPDPSVDLSAVPIGSGDSYLSRAYTGLTTADRVMLVAHNDQSMIYDELRIGTTWADITPVPEPAAMMLLGVAGMAGLIRPRRRCNRQA